MTTHLEASRGETLTRLAAVATQLENEGQYNLAKLARASVDALVRRAAFENPAPQAPGDLAAQLETISAKLAEFDVSDALVTAFRRGTAAMQQGRLPLIDETPHPYVCRTCGHVALGAPGKCPTCGAWAATFQKFPPVYWLDALDPFAALAYLRQTPREVSALLDGLSESVLTQPAPGGGWSIRQIVTHMRDAQGVLDFRMGLILNHNNPKLESLAVFEWADRPQKHPTTTSQILDEYHQVREKILTQLANIPLASWWRTGQHLEFGEVTLRQQVSYFASHELTHLPQLEQLSAGR